MKCDYYEKYNLKQRSLRELLDCCRERTKDSIRKYKKKAKWYWPELHLYCGVCKLRTGLYIRSIICLVFYIIATVINIFMVYYIVEGGRFLFSMDMSALEDYFEVNLTDDKLERAKKIYTLVVAYLVLWCAFKMIYILSLVSTIYAMYKKKPKILKIVIFNNTLNWILDIILSLFGAVLTQLFSKVLVIFCILFEGYNLLALSSEYKQLKGKSKLIINLPNTTNVEQPTVASNPISGNISNELNHCQTCTCYEPMLPSTSESVTANVTSQCLYVEEKIVNIKDVEIIFNQDQLLPHSSCILETNIRPIRPTVLELPPYLEENEVKKEKELPDMVVIYDQNQLNVCGSPVIESQENR
ncbi:PREDICTED: uncharacterized protein LOC106113654 isoform X2 [Papilio xuthus]|uniref:Uncharacterized protein LOC106113654 isoform X2 n=1 Tax=Papilio xuthus TaxID=66420 RepID=A0AAJ7E443_PAPXU|nr:PREDICTED: uncharacterized protein LOC106113654 isoform X2 [Papilio xuthus]